MITSFNFNLTQYSFLMIPVKIIKMHLKIPEIPILKLTKKYLQIRKKKGNFLKHHAKVLSVETFKRIRSSTVKVN